MAVSIHAIGTVGLVLILLGASATGFAEPVLSLEDTEQYLAEKFDSNSVDFVYIEDWLKLSPEKRKLVDPWEELPRQEKSKAGSVSDRTTVVWLRKDNDGPLRFFGSGPQRSFRIRTAQFGTDLNVIENFFELALLSQEVRVVQPDHGNDRVVISCFKSVSCGTSKWQRLPDGEERRYRTAIFQLFFKNSTEAQRIANAFRHLIKTFQSKYPPKRDPFDN
jgi:hypothetical protein